MNSDIAIDWRWVKEELDNVERIQSVMKSNLRDSIRSCADRCLGKAKELVRPKLVSKLVRVEKIEDGRVRLEDGVIFTSGRLPRHLNGAGRLYLFLVTIGGRLEAEASRLMSKGDSLAGYLLDRIGSLAVESLAEEAERDVRKQCEAKGEKVSARFSPGYCDWPVEEQNKLTKILDFSRAGVRLTERCMMDPKKSISAMIAISKKGDFLKTGSPCAICDMSDCSYRRDVKR